MIGHLGSRVSALLDGRLPAHEEERAWEHVHACHPCRDLVEREGWVKTRLAELGHGRGAAPDSLKESLRGALLAQAPDGASRMQEAHRYPGAPSFSPAGRSLLDPRSSALPDPVRPRARHAVTVGTGAVGIAVLGVLALGGPAQAPQIDRRGPVTSVVPPTPSIDPRPRSERPSDGTPARRQAVREKMGP